MKQYEAIKEQLVSIVQGQMNNLHNTDAKELGEVVDMIKDLEEAIYYCTITEAMNKEEPYEKKRYMMYDDRFSRDMERDYGRMYYDGKGSSHMKPFDERVYTHPLDMRDVREGKSPMSRKSYMESRDMHKDKSMKLKDLEKYMSELSEDITEMIDGASPEE